MLRGQIFHSLNKHNLDLVYERVIVKKRYIKKWIITGIVSNGMILELEIGIGHYRLKLSLEWTSSGVILNIYSLNRL